MAIDILWFLVSLLAAGMFGFLVGYAYGAYAAEVRK